jgi:hypothetical protein
MIRAEAHGGEQSFSGGEEIKLTRQRRIKPRSSEEQSLGSGKESSLDSERTGLRAKQSLGRR